MKKPAIFVVLTILFFLSFLIFTQDTSPTEEKTNPNSGGQTVSILSEGGSLGGHTPRGFQGQGSGIFVGDNLNPGFPNGDGLQAFLSFDLSGVDNREFNSAKLTSSDLHVQGSPFEDLGKISVDRVLFNNFSSSLWDTKPISTVCVLERTEGTEVSCDISETLNSALADDQKSLQIRLRFEKISDNDNQPDLALFYKTNSNTNDRSVFNIELSSQSVDERNNEEISVEVVLHLIKDSGLVSTVRDEENVRDLFEKSQKIWEPANIVFDVLVTESVVDENIQKRITAGDYQSLQSVKPDDNKIHIYYVRSLGRINGIALGEGLAAVADITTVNDYRTTAHEIGHLFGLGHTSDTRNRLMFRGANGENLTEEEIKIVRNNLERIYN